MGSTCFGVAGASGRHPSGTVKVDAAPSKKALWSSTGGSMLNCPKAVSPAPWPPVDFLEEDLGPKLRDILRRPSKVEYSSEYLADETRGLY
eukprot:9457037-Pyramimonas_sp.AAC.2